MEKPISNHLGVRLWPILYLITGPHQPTAIHTIGLDVSFPYYFRPRPEGWSYAGGYIAPFLSTWYGKHLASRDMVSRSFAFWAKDERLAATVWYGGELGYVWGGGETTPWFLGLAVLSGTMQGRFLDNGEMANPSSRRSARVWFGYRFQ